MEKVLTDADIRTLLELQFLGTGFAVCSFRDIRLKHISLRRKPAIDLHGGPIATLERCSSEERDYLGIVFHGRLPIAPWDQKSWTPIAYEVVFRVIDNTVRERVHLGPHGHFCQCGFQRKDKEFSLPGS